jgi:hypothetical protein
MRSAEGDPKGDPRTTALAFVADGAVRTPAGDGVVTSAAIPSPSCRSIGAALGPPKSAWFRPLSHFSKPRRR